jgi:cell division septal protein FtsQ
VLWIIVVVSVVTTLSFLSKADFLQITSVEVTGTNLVPAGSVQTVIENKLVGDWWHLFAKDSIFLYPKNALAAVLVKEYPPITSVDFSYSGFHILNVKINERTPFALACDSDTDQCFYMDSTGFIYASAPQFSPGVYVSYTIASTSSELRMPIVIGTFITDPTDFAIARQAVSYISRLDLTVVGINVPLQKSGDFQIFIQRPSSLTTSASTVTATSSPVITVYFNSSQPLDTTLEYFSAFWQNETNKNFQYIDLRYGKDIVFKIQ